MQQGSPVDVRRISVRPIFPSEQARFDTGLDEHHWFSHSLVGETMRYVALSSDGEWLALVGFGATALACRPRDSFCWLELLPAGQADHADNIATDHVV